MLQAMVPTKVADRVSNCGIDTDALLIQTKERKSIAQSDPDDCF